MRDLSENHPIKESTNAKDDLIHKKRSIETHRFAFFHLSSILK
jgi:hypothetical protein